MPCWWGCKLTQPLWQLFMLPMLAVNRSRWSRSSGLRLQFSVLNDPTFSGRSNMFLYKPNKLDLRSLKCVCLCVCVFFFFWKFTLIHKTFSYVPIYDLELWVNRTKLVKHWRHDSVHNKHHTHHCLTCFWLQSNILTEQR